ncbi:thiamine pyrophosphokinase-related protein [Verticillium dahliae]
MSNLSNIDLTNNIDSFPYGSIDEIQGRLQQPLYTLRWKDVRQDIPLGYVPPDVLARLEETPSDVRGDIDVDHARRTVYAFQGTTEPERSAVVAALMNHWRSQDAFPVLRGWRDELWPIYANDGELLYNMERSATGLFGVTRYGVHLNAFVRCAEASHGIKMWIARRSPTKSTFPGMLDNTAAGGLMTGEDPFECIIREANEEADLAEDVVRGQTLAAGGVTYTYITHEEAGQAGLIYPEVQWIYDLELQSNVVPRPKDGEVAGFELCGIEEVQHQLAHGKFKPNCALVVIDFLIRHGILTRDNEPDFNEIKLRLHRELPFPGPHKFESSQN